MVIVGDYVAPSARQRSDFGIHRHPSIEILVAPHGRLAVTDGHTSDVGSAVAVPCGAPHTLYSISTDVRVYAVHLHPVFPEARLLMEEFSKAAPTDGVSGWLRLGSSALDADLSGDLTAMEAGDRITQAIVANIGRELPEPNTTLESAMDMVIDHLPERVYLRDLAESVAVSESTLARMLARDAHTTYPTMLRGMRLMYALAEVFAGRTLTDAAHAAGFTDGTHLTKVCREMTGTTPSTIMSTLPRLNTARRRLL